MSDSVLQTDPAISSDMPVPFRFEVTWRLLGQPAFSGVAQPVSVLGGDVEGNEWKPNRASAPSFSTAGDRSRRSAALLGVMLALITIAFGAMRTMDHRSPTPGLVPTKAMEMGGAGWMSEWASDSAGSARGRQISLYRPSISMSNYRLEFIGRIEQKSLGWVFRAANSKNYYVVKLQASRPGASLILDRFAVIRSAEGPHRQVMLPSVSGSGPLKVRLDANRSRFTIYVQNQVVEDWEDDRLKTGGVGFLNEREERGLVQSVQISFPKTGVAHE